MTNPDLEPPLNALDERFDRLERKLNLILGLMVLAVLAPALTQLFLGP